MRPIKLLRRGFTLVEITVAAVIVAVLAAVTVPSMISYLEFQDVRATRDMFLMLRDGITNSATGANAFYQKVGTTYPGRLSELTAAISTAAATNPNSCGTAFTATQVTAWNSNGPFVSTLIPRTGLPSPLGLIDDVLVRAPNSATAGTLAIRMLGQPLAVAQELDNLIDPLATGIGDLGAAGSLRYVANGALYDISYLVPVVNKC
jgi:prepilin-type N-terminal cleavage/methylation domain-containing protein